MCRLAYITRRFKSLSGWLTKLEKSFGGDGNGLAVAGRVIKAVNLSVAESVGILLSVKGPALWHTRKTSSGTKCDELCHPFECHHGWLVHNGHWSEGDKMVNTLKTIYQVGPMSDTKLFAMIVNRLGFFSATKKYRPNGVWLWMDKSGKLSIFKNGGSLWHSAKLGALGSEPSEEPWARWYKIADGYFGPNHKIEPEPEIRSASVRDFPNLLELDKETGQLRFI